MLAVICSLLTALALSSVVKADAILGCQKPYITDGSQGFMIKSNSDFSDNLGPTETPNECAEGCRAWGRKYAYYGQFKWATSFAWYNGREPDGWDKFTNPDGWNGQYYYYCECTDDRMDWEWWTAASNSDYGTDGCGEDYWTVVLVDNYQVQKCLKESPEQIWPTFARNETASYEDCLAGCDTGPGSIAVAQMNRQNDDNGYPTEGTINCWCGADLNELADYSSDCTGFDPNGSIVAFGSSS